MKFHESSSRKIITVTRPTLNLALAYIVFSCVLIIVCFFDRDLDIHRTVHIIVSITSWRGSHGTYNSPGKAPRDFGRS